MANEAVNQRAGQAFDHAIHPVRRHVVVLITSAENRARGHRRCSAERMYLRRRPGGLLCVEMRVRNFYRRNLAPELQDAEHEHALCLVLFIVYFA